MSETNNNTPMRISQLEEATAYEEGMYYAVAKAGSGTKKVSCSVINNDVSSLKSYNVKSANLFERSKANLHLYYNTLGVVSENAQLTGMYIKVKPNTKYTISNVSTYSASLDINYNWIESYVNTTNPQTIVTPENAYYLYVAVNNTQSTNIATVNVNEGENALSYTEGYEIPKMANKGLHFGDVTPLATDFCKIGTNLINKRNYESGFYLSYNYGMKVTQTGWSTIIFAIDSNKEYTFSGAVAHISYWTTERYFIGGQLVSSVSSVNLTIPENTKYIAISVSSTSIGTARLNEGTTDKGYEPFQIEIPELKTDWSFDFSKFKYPYIRDCKVMCNKASETITAYYAGVDCGSVITTIESRFIWESGSVSGTVALILNKNGLSKITDITDLSLHLVMTNDHVKVDVLGNRYGQAYYQTIINKNFSTPMELDGETEHKIVFSVDLSNEKVYAYIDDSEDYSASGTFTPDANISSLSDVIGQYATFEHYTNVNRDATAMPMFTKFYCRDKDNVVKVYDYFDREDGQLQNTPQGLPYHLISTSHNIG